MAEFMTITPWLHGQVLHKGWHCKKADKSIRMNWCLVKKWSDTEYLRERIISLVFLLRKHSVSRYQMLLSHLHGCLQASLSDNGIHSKKECVVLLVLHSTRCPLKSFCLLSYLCFIEFLLIGIMMMLAIVCGTTSREMCVSWLSAAAATILFLLLSVEVIHDPGLLAVMNTVHLTPWIIIIHRSKRLYWSNMASVPQVVKSDLSPHPWQYLI